MFNKPPSNDDYAAMLDACLDEGRGFSETLREIRNMRWLDIRTAVGFLCWLLRESSHPRSKEVLKVWENRNA